MQNLRNRLHQWFVPSHHNEYHPHLIAERGLLILFALILGAEAFLVSHTVATQPGTPTIASVGSYTGSDAAAVLPPFLSELSRYWMRYVTEPLSSLAAHREAGRVSFIVLAGVAAALMGMMAHTLSVRRKHFQPVGYIAGGSMLAFAVTLLYYNTNVMLPYFAGPQQTAAVAPSIVQTVTFPLAASIASTTALSEKAPATTTDSL
jgi:hypothetical protein